MAREGKRTKTTDDGSVGAANKPSSSPKCFCRTVSNKSIMLSVKRRVVVVPVVVVVKDRRRNQKPDNNKYIRDVLASVTIVYDTHGQIMATN